MKFLVNGKIKELNIYDENGINWAADLIGDTLSGCQRDEETELLIMSEEDYKWWDEYIRNYTADEKEMKELMEEYNINTEEMNAKLTDALQYEDMEYHHYAKQKLFDDIRAE